MSLEECPCCRHYKMFFQVAADALKVDPSCEPGKIDPMCTADAVRQLQADLSRSEELNRELAQLLKVIEEDDLLPMAYALEGGKEIRDVLKELLKRVKEMGK